MSARLRRPQGDPEKLKERMDRANEAEVFHGRCRICGEALSGTPAQLKAHRHEISQSDPSTS